MTLCRKCGKEITDGEELCEICKNKESQMDEAYLEELMQNMSDEEKEPENAGEPAPVMDDQVEEKPAEEASDGEADVNDLLALLSTIGYILLRGKSVFLDRDKDFLKLVETPEIALKRE